MCRIGRRESVPVVDRISCVDERVIQYQLVEGESDVKNEPSKRERVVFVDICGFAPGMLRVRCACYCLIQSFGAVTRVYP